MTMMMMKLLSLFGLLCLHSGRTFASICGVPEQVGDVWVELPGKAGTVISPQSVPSPANMTTQERKTIGLGTNGTLPIPLFVQLNDQFLNSSDAAYVPADVVDELKTMNEFYTTEKAGMVICDVYTSPAGTSSRAWRPFNLTRGWHYELWGTCSASRGWSASGIDASVDLVGECNAEATKCLWLQTFRPGTEQFGASLQSVSVKVAGALTEAQIQSCCFPSTEDSRDCSAVEDVVNGYNATPEDYAVFAASGAGPGRTVVSGILLIFFLVFVV